MLILDKKIVRPGDVEMSSMPLRWVVYEHEKRDFEGWYKGTDKVPKNMSAVREAINQKGWGEDLLMESSHRPLS